SKMYLFVRVVRAAQPSPREAGRGWPERSEGRVRGNDFATRITNPTEIPALAPHPPRRHSASKTRVTALMAARHPLPASRGEGRSTECAAKRCASGRGGGGVQGPLQPTRHHAAPRLSSAGPS